MKKWTSSGRQVGVQATGVVRIGMRLEVEVRGVGDMQVGVPGALARVLTAKAGAGARAGEVQVRTGARKTDTRVGVEAIAAVDARVEAEARITMKEGARVEVAA